MRSTFKLRKIFVIKWDILYTKDIVINFGVFEENQESYLFTRFVISIKDG
ncbi:hypothetical protein CBE01nite_44000 [Clostridium beijerinckii]|nr:hypothetical protein CBE01nite_44000 [Clostridium beijerinckii]